MLSITFSERGIVWLNSLHKWAENNKMEVNRNKCKILHLEMSKSNAQVESLRLGNKSFEKDFGIVIGCIMAININEYKSAVLYGFLKDKCKFRLHQ